MPDLTGDIEVVAIPDMSGESHRSIFHFFRRNLIWGLITVAFA
jgi:hypothetical protein